jgi:phage shock protein C
MDQQQPRRLTRSPDRKVAGVAGGLAEYFDLDPTVVRLAWLLAGIFTGGTAVIAYLLFWLVMPEPATGEARVPASREQKSRTLVALLLVAAVFVMVAGAAMPLSMMAFMTGMPGRVMMVAPLILLILLIALVVFLAARIFGRQPR